MRTLTPWCAGGKIDEFSLSFTIYRFLYVRRSFFLASSTWSVFTPSLLRPRVPHFCFILFYFFFPILFCCIIRPLLCLCPSAFATGADRKAER